MDMALIDVIIRNGGVVVNSRNVAEAFHKRHDNVLQRIENIRKDWKKLHKELGSKVSSVNDEPNAEMRSVNELPLKVRADAQTKPLQFRKCFIRNDYLTAHA